MENIRHDSDCAQHNEPAYRKGPCDCSASKTAPVRQLQCTEAGYMTAHFHKMSDELMSARCRVLEIALWRLANECDGMRAFEADIKAVTGHMNWGVLRLRVDEAREVLSAIPEDILRAAALAQKPSQG